MMSITVLRSSLLGLVILGFEMPVAGQDAAAQETTLQTLLKEVHALRVALERSNQIGPKIQIALARMQLQEERVRGATRQAEEARNQVAGVQLKRSEIADKVKDSEKQEMQTVDPKERTAIAREIELLKGELERLSTLDQQYRATEAEANALLRSEQARWNEASDLLASIERALTPPAQP